MLLRITHQKYLKLGYLYYYLYTMHLLKIFVFL